MSISSPFIALPAADFTAQSEAWRAAWNEIDRLTSHSVAADLKQAYAPFIRRRVEANHGAVPFRSSAIPR